MLRLLEKAPVECELTAGGDKMLLESDKCKRIAVAPEVLATLACEGFFSRNLRIVRLSSEGQAAAQRVESVADPF